MQEIIDEILSKKKFAVIGSFRDQYKYAYRILKKLILQGCTVYPVNPNIEQVEGFKCYKSIIDIPDTPECANIVTPPKVTEEIVKECLAKGIRLVWMQPGAESNDAIKFCNENNIKVVHDACILNV
jgi:hypothetical protein